LYKKAHSVTVSGTFAVKIKIKTTSARGAQLRPQPPSAVLPPAAHLPLQTVAECELMDEHTNERIGERAIYQQTRRITIPMAEVINHALLREKYKFVTEATEQIASKLHYRDIDTQSQMLHVL